MERLGFALTVVISLVGCLPAGATDTCMVEVRVLGTTYGNHEVPCQDVAGIFTQPRQVVVNVPPTGPIGP